MITTEKKIGENTFNSLFKEVRFKKEKNVIHVFNGKSIRKRIRTKPNSIELSLPNVIMTYSVFGGSLEIRYEVYKNFTNIQSILESLGLKVEYEYTSDAYEVDNPELWGHYILKTTKHQLLTRQLKSQLKPGALRQIKKLKEMYGVNPPNPIIADIGANIGYFSESFLEVYPECELHAYEPQPDNLNELRQLQDSRFTIHEYGLFDSDGEFEIGMRSDGKSNNGTYSIFNKENLSSVPFKNANNETIRPHIVKMDVEGAEANILECEDFFSETQAILIELIITNEFNMIKKTEDNLKKLGFKYKCHLGKNDQLWLK